jgi:hypothetical protein
MRRSDITIGGTYRCKVGSRLALVTVIEGPRAGSTRYRCRTHDTDRAVLATAAKLRPLPGTALADAERERLAAAAARRAVANAPRPFAGPVGEATVDAAPIPGILANVGPSPVAALSAANHDTIRRIVDACHVAEGFAYVARRVRAKVAAHVIWATIPRALRRGILHAAAQRHGEGRRLYRLAMRHAPLPSERMVAEAVGIACGLGPMPR